MPIKNILKQIYPAHGTWRAMIVTPDKQEKNYLGKAGMVMNDSTGPIAAFSKPPPLPPVLGPLFALSLLEMG